MKICNKCGHEKDDDKFISKKTGRATKMCKRCRDHHMIIYHKNLCPHGREKCRCRQCILDPKLPLAKQIWHNSINHDRKQGKYEPENHITKEEILKLLEEYTTCFWDDCNCNLQYIHKQRNLATLERLSNSIGHLAGNCVIACMYCNKTRKSDGHGIPHVCVKCSAEEARHWYKIDEEWYCISCKQKIQVLCDICDKQYTKHYIADHMRRKH